MRLTADDFEARAFFTLFEVVAAVSSDPRGRRNVRRWLHQTGAISTNEAGAHIVTRIRLEMCFPEILETLRRRCCLSRLGWAPSSDGSPPTPPAGRGPAGS